MPKIGSTWSKFDDLTGKKIGRWTVIKKSLRPISSRKRKNGTPMSQTMYLCLCECGIEKWVKPCSLRNGDSKSCGCLRSEIKAAKSLIGKRFGNITVIERTKQKKGSRYIYRCLCHHCDSEFLTPAYGLSSGNIKSCGCIPRGARYKPGEGGFNLLLYEYEEGAHKRGIDFDLTVEQFREITNSNCFYCGVKPESIKNFSKAKTNHAAYIYNGIDRIDNEIGYLYDNCVPCCTQCNFAKGKMDVNEFIKMVNQIALLHPIQP